MSIPTLPVPDQVVPFVTVTNWIRAARRCGIDIEALFLAEGMDITRLHPSTATIRPAAVARIMHRCLGEARRLGCPHHFPIVLGDTFAFEYLSDVETFISTSATLRDAARALTWIPPLVNPLLTFELQEFGDRARIVLRLGHETAPTPPEEAWPFLEAAFTTLVKFSKTLLTDVTLAGRLTLRHGAHEHSAHLASHLQVELEHDAPIDALWFDRALLDRPLIGALPGLHEVAAQRITEEIARRAPPAEVSQPSHHPLVRQIEQTYLTRPALLGEGLAALASELGLHPRTLQRRLRDAGDSHSAILDRVRFHLARQWLSTPPVQIESVALRLGFADRRSFTQAFIRWTGVPPRRYQAASLPSGHDD
ncbi:MAG: helix-turn-helix domain-containing protein [Aquabacterium sp.]